VSCCRRRAAPAPPRDSNPSKIQIFSSNPEKPLQAPVFHDRTCQSTATAGKGRANLPPLNPQILGQLLTLRVLPHHTRSRSMPWAPRVLLPHGSPQHHAWCGSVGRSRQEQRAASGARVSPLRELWSRGHRVPVSRPKCREGASFHPKGSPSCQLHPTRSSQQVMQRGRMLSEGGFGSICKAKFRVKNLSSGHIPAISTSPRSPGGFLTSEYSGGGRKRNSWM